MKRIVITAALCIASSLINAGGGSSFGYGLLGGVIGAGLVSSASQPRYVQSQPQTVVIRDEPRQQVVQRVVCVNQDGYEIPCPPKRQRVADHPDNY